MGLEAAQIAFDWQANENKTRLHAFLRKEPKRLAHELEMDIKFRDEVQSICEYVAGRKKHSIEPLDWKAYFKNLPLTDTLEPLAVPDETKLRPGSLEHCLAWSDYNIQRVGQHRITLSICEHIVRDSHVFQHLELPLARAKSWVYSQEAQLNAIRMQLIVLEGDPSKVQALREEMLDDIRVNNRSTDHFYGHFNGQQSSNSEAKKRFRTEALRHVQARFEPGIGEELSAPHVSYSDLGLG